MSLLAMRISQRLIIFCITLFIFIIFTTLIRYRILFAINFIRDNIEGNQLLPPFVHERVLQFNIVRFIVFLLIFVFLKLTYNLLNCNSFLGNYYKLFSCDFISFQLSTQYFLTHFRKLINIVWNIV